MFDYLTSMWILWALISFMCLCMCVDAHKREGNYQTAKELRVASLFFALTPFAPVLMPLAIIASIGSLIFNGVKFLIKKSSWMTSTIANAWRYDEVSN